MRARRSTWASSKYHKPSTSVTLKIIRIPYATMARLAGCSCILTALKTDARKSTAPAVAVTPAITSMMTASPQVMKSPLNHVNQAG